MRIAQTVLLHGEKHGDHLGKCSFTRPTVPDNHFRSTQFRYSSSKGGIMKGRNNWSGLLNGGREEEVEVCWKKKMKKWETRLSEVTSSVWGSCWAG